MTFNDRNNADTTCMKNIRTLWTSFSENFKGDSVDFGKCLRMIVSEGTRCKFQISDTRQDANADGDAAASADEKQ